MPQVSDAAVTDTCLVCNDAEAIKLHMERFTLKSLPDEGKYKDLRTLQDSPLFGLSESYRSADGAVRTLPANPPNVTVTLRPYQSQATQWMLDQENRSSSKRERHLFMC